MAVIQGVGYPAPNLSHFRSIEIWDTAADSDQYLPSGWLTRASRGNAAFQACSADGAIIGAADPGPLGGGARAVALQDPERFASVSSGNCVPASMRMRYRMSLATRRFSSTTKSMVRVRSGPLSESSASRKSWRSFRLATGRLGDVATNLPLHSARTTARQRSTAE